MDFTYKYCKDNFDAIETVLYNFSIVERKLDRITEIIEEAPLYAEECRETGYDRDEIEEKVNEYIARYEKKQVALEKELVEAEEKLLSICGSKENILKMKKICDLAMGNTIRIKTVIDIYGDKIGNKKVSLNDFNPLEKALRSRSLMLKLEEMGYDICCEEDYLAGVEKEGLIDEVLIGEVEKHIKSLTKEDREL